MATARTPPMRKKEEIPKVDLGKQRGVYDTPDLREKILKWQTPPKSSSSVEKDAKTSDKSSKDSPKQETAKLTEMQEPEKSITEDNAEPETSPVGRAPIEDDTTLEQDLRAASAPKKRVVSDEHWRKGQSPSASKTTVISKPTTPVLGFEQTLYMRPGSNKYDGWMRPRSTPTKVSKPEKTIKANPESSPQKPTQPIVITSTKRKTLAIIEDPTKLATPSPSPPAKRKITPTREPKVEQDKLCSSSETIVVKEKLSKSSPSHPRKISQEKKTTPVISIVQKQGKPVGVLNQPPVRVKAAAVGARENVSNSVKDEEEIFAHVAETRVDAWLTNTPDPFIDDEESGWSDAEQSSPIELASTAQFVKPLSIRVRNVEAGKETRQSEQREKTPQRRELKYSIIRRSIKIDPEARESQNEHRTAADNLAHEYNRTHEEELSDNSASDILGSTTPTLKRSKATRKTTSPRSNRTRSGSMLESVTSDSHSEVLIPYLGRSIEHQFTKVNDENSSPWYKDRARNHSNRLTTIASVETLSTVVYDNTPGIPHSRSAGELRQERTIPAHETVAEQSDAESRSRPRLARKMTSHADLISVLSMADGDGKGLRPANSSGSRRTKDSTLRLVDLMAEMKTDEAKYLRELRTLVDGVVPVLLNCVVSRSTSAIAAGLYDNLQSGSDAAAPIMGMGVALERLKSAHQRMPNSSPDALLMWAQGSHRIYADYLQAWRMGFHDVVVNLAPADKSTTVPSSDPLRNILPQNEEGYIVNDNGGKVDVAFLLKRPLVRLKYLARTLKNIESLAPSEQASMWAAKYQDLVIEARKRQDEERARLEDQAASRIDPTRAREPETLAPLAGVRINPRRYVRARDFFTLKLQHSSGQRIDCGVELLLRENMPELGEGGDVLICEVDSASKWLLFPPIQISQISARAGDLEDEIIGMIRGQALNGLEWYELLSLKAGNPLISHDWIQLLGTKPCPPPLADHKIAEISSSPLDQSGVIVLAHSDKPRTPSQMVVDVPIGEKAGERAKQWRSQSSMVPERITAKFAPRTTTYYEDDYDPQSPVGIPSSPTGSQVSHSWRQNFTPSLAPESTRGNSPAAPRSVVHPSRSPLPSPPPTHHMDHGNTHSDRHQTPPKRPLASRGDLTSSSTISRTSSYTVWYPQDDESLLNSGAESQHYTPRGAGAKRPGMERRISNTPTEALPHIPRVRMNSPNQGYGVGDGFVTNQSPGIRRKEVPGSKPTSRHYEHTSDNPLYSNPRTPKHSSPSRINGPSMQSTPVSSAKRRSSSPLKREYRPSSDSDSNSSSAMGDVQSDDDESFTSDSSADDFSHTSIPTGLFRPRIPSGSVYSPKSPETLTPSQSASQGPYRTVPPQDVATSIMVAMLFCWSEKGSWESIHPDECSVVVSPGLIEAFEKKDSHLNTGQRIEGAKPLVALELTPLVPLRRGTALDISIRSPPTANSRFRAGNNLMFRSHTGQECELLYGHINQARINNPTYIALQNARGPFGGTTWASYMDQRANKRSNSAWWRFGSKKSSYRKTNTFRSGTGGNSSVAQTESSVGIISDGAGTGAMSALRRFSSNSKAFNVAKSTVTSRGRVSGSSTTFTSSSGTSSSIHDPHRSPNLTAAASAAAGITNALHIRLYLRETASKWRDMGAGRLCIMHPAAAGTMLSPQKRVLVTGKTRGETLLDAVLGETSFERVARTGIAVNIWEERRGPNGEVGVVGKTGGVGAGKGRVYMVQCKSEAETAYAFSLLGRLRY